MNTRTRRRERPAWVIGDSAGGTVVALVFFALTLLTALLAARVSLWAWLLVLLTMLAIVDAIASIVYRRRHIPGLEHDGADQGDGT